MPEHGSFTKQRSCTQPVVMIRANLIHNARLELLWRNTLRRWYTLRVLPHTCVLTRTEDTSPTDDTSSENTNGDSLRPSLRCIDLHRDATRKNGKTFTSRMIIDNKINFVPYFVSRLYARELRATIYQLRTTHFDVQPLLNYRAL